MIETIDAHVPQYHFRQRCSRVVAAPREDVWAALVSVTMADLRLTRTLMSVRHLGRTAPPGKPIFTHGPVTLLHVEEGVGALAGKVTKAWQVSPTNHTIGSLADFDAFAQPGWVKFLTSFDLRDVAGGIELSTETRGICTNERSRRFFKVYWTMIKPGAELVRRDILATVGALATGRAAGHAAD